ncbi:MAG: hypothetical protein HN704_03570 [Bacteroidetes bacterium]|nr:hypothetical protein [Bacteroidota bacterium]MBT6686701.1 hypothetical protein [Bacteroidota bacterium]MBT7141839.1 hypothetical protein [Bacteroidota bacterium]MBT7490670.1 hypothetical protein [Bacteroidota bacterium]
MKIIYKIIILILIVIAINQILYYSQTSYSWGSERFHQKRIFVEKNADHFNTFFIGSSKTGQNIIPELFDTEVKAQSGDNLNSFNFGSGSIVAPESYYLYENLLENEDLNIKYVFFELSSISTVSEKVIHTNKGKYWYTPSYYTFSLKSLLTSQYKLKNKLAGIKNHTICFAEQIFNIQFVHDLVAYNKMNDRKLPDFPLLGYTAPLQSEIPERLAGAIKLQNKFFEDTTILTKSAKISLQQNFDTDEVKKYNTEHFEKITKIIELSEKHGVKIFFVLHPGIGKRYRQVLPLFKKIDPKYRIELSDAKKYPEFYIAKNSFDGKHLNNKGAKIFTKLLAEKFIELNKAD